MSDINQNLVEKFMNKMNTEMADADKKILTLSTKPPFINKKTEKKRTMLNLISSDSEDKKESHKSIKKSNTQRNKPPSKSLGKPFKRDENTAKKSAPYYHRTHTLQGIVTKSNKKETKGKDQQKQTIPQNKTERSQYVRITPKNVNIVIKKTVLPSNVALHSEEPEVQKKQKKNQKYPRLIQHCSRQKSSSYSSIFYESQESSENQSSLSSNKEEQIPPSTSYNYTKTAQGSSQAKKYHYNHKEQHFKNDQCISPQQVKYIKKLIQEYVFEQLDVLAEKIAEKLQLNVSLVNDAIGNHQIKCDQLPTKRRLICNKEKLGNFNQVYETKQQSRKLEKKSVKPESTNPKASQTSIEAQRKTMTISNDRQKIKGDQLQKILMQIDKRVSMVEQKQKGVISSEKLKKKLVIEALDILESYKNLTSTEKEHIMDQWINIKRKQQEQNSPRTKNT